jgi:hypothetical protein
MFWSHGDFEWNVIGIDKRVSHYNQSENFVYEVFSFSMDIQFLDPIIDRNKLKKERAKFPKGVVILGSIGRLMKMDSAEYLEVISILLNKYPNTIYLACGPGHIEEIKEKLDKNIIDRVYFEGYVDAHIYGHIIDIFLDSFPLEHGNSKWEFAVKDGGKPMVLFGKKISSTDLYDNFIEFGYKKELIPLLETIDGYLEFSSKLIEDVKLRKEVGVSCRNIFELSKTNSIEKLVRLISE